MGCRLPEAGKGESDEVSQEGVPSKEVRGGPPRTSGGFQMCTSLRRKQQEQKLEGKCPRVQDVGQDSLGSCEPRGTWARRTY